MSGMETKIMLHRAAEFSKDQSLLQKKVDASQAAAFKQVQAEVNMQTTNVNDVYKAEQAMIQKEKEKKKKHANQMDTDTEDEKKMNSQEQQPKPEFDDVHKKIDIRI